MLSILDYPIILVDQRQMISREAMTLDQVDGILFRKWREESKHGLKSFCSLYQRSTGETLHPANLSHMELGKRPIPSHVIEKAAPLLGKKPEDFPGYFLQKNLPSKLTDPRFRQVIQELARIEVNKLSEGDWDRIMEVLHHGAEKGADNSQT